MRIYIFAILIITTISILTASKTKLPEDELDWMKFMWVGDSLGSQYFDKTRIYLPVNVQGIPYDFTLQFDLGLNVTLVYEPSIRPYLTLYPTIEQKLDTASAYDYLRQVDIMIDGHKFEDRSILLSEDDRNVLTVDSVNSSTVKHIGSIGADLFQDKVLIIDYPNTRIAVAEQIPSSLASEAVFVDMSLDKRGRPVLPLRVKDKERKVMFDTGSSLFQLITSPQNWATVTSGQITDSVLVTSFGKEYYLYGAETDDIFLGDQRLPKATCYKAEEKTDFLQANDLWGITGNAYFWNYTVIVDFANKKFGVIK